MSSTKSYKIYALGLTYSITVKVEGGREEALERYAEIQGYDDFATFCVEKKMNPNMFDVELVRI